MKLCLTGMHRSGTSFFASYLKQIGFVFGTELRGARKGNVRGHFEDLEFQAINNELLKSNISHKFFPILRNRTPNKTIKKAESLLEKCPNLFVWKDPRSSLFLEFWDYVSRRDVIYIFMLRHPDLVYDSLIRRGTDKPLKYLPGLSYYSWYKYNLAIGKFYKKYEDRAFIIEIDNLMDKKDELALSKLEDRTGVKFPPVEFVVDQKLFSRAGSKDKAIVEPFNLGYRSRCLNLYQALKIESIV